MKGTEALVLEVGKERIPFTLCRTHLCRVTISVHPDRQVLVSAPADKSVEQIVTRVKRRASWIVRQREYFRQFLPGVPPRKYISGETFLYLGRHYRLKVIEGGERAVKVIGRRMVVGVPVKSDAYVVKRLVRGWYEARAADVFGRRVKHCRAMLEGHGIGDVRIRIAPMVRRWGSCSRRGGITLNTALVRAPVHCIDYVVLHELCHLLFRQHGKQFYRLLGMVLPDWKERKERLERISIV
jgi:predicted metal-dependent hydrolase